MKKNVWIAGMTAILSAGLVWLAPVFTLADERIPDGVSVGAVSLSGLTEEEAEKQIESYVNEKLNQDITLVVNGTEAKSDAQTLGVAWDNQDEVAEAIQGKAVYEKERPGGKSGEDRAGSLRGPG